MRFKKKTLVAVVSCAMMFAAAPLLPAGLSVMASAYAKDGGGHGAGGNGGGGAGAGGGHSGTGHSAGSTGKGLAEGHEVDHDGKAVRDHGMSGNHVGRGLKNDRGHGVATSGVAHSKTTQGLSKAAAISATTPGDHNARGLSRAGTSTSH